MHEPVSCFPQLTRRYYNQNRNHTVNTISCLIDWAIEQHEYYKYIKKDEYIEKYLNLLNGCKLGLLNLKFTYENDYEISNKINEIIDKITLYIKN